MEAEGVGRFEIQNVDYERLEPLMLELIQRGNRQLALFVPAELSTPLYLNPNVVEFREDREFLRVGRNAEVRLILTSKYANLKELLLIDRSFGTWIHNAENFNGLRLDYERVGGAIEFSAKLRVFYRAERPTSAIIVRPREYA